MNKNLIETMKRLRERELLYEERIKEIKMELRLWSKRAQELLVEKDVLEEGCLYVIAQREDLMREIKLEKEMAKAKK